MAVLGITRGVLNLEQVGHVCKIPVPVAEHFLPVVFFEAWEYSVVLILDREFIQCFVGKMLACLRMFPHGSLLVEGTETVVFGEIFVPSVNQISVEAVKLNVQLLESP